MRREEKRKAIDGEGKGAHVIIGKKPERKTRTDTGKKAKREKSEERERVT